MTKKYRIAFVFIVESGDLENKAILLGESLRKFFPSTTEVPIYAVRPRKGKEISENTKSRFKNLGISYIYDPVNVVWRNLPFANQAYGSALVEDKLKDDVEVLAYLDADIVCLKYPVNLYMSADKQILVTPVDVFSGGAAKYGESLPVNFKFSYEINNINAKNLWPILTKIDRIEIYPCFNSGFIAVRPEIGIFRKWRETFEISARRGYFGIVNPFSQAFFYTDQVFLASTILSKLERNEIGVLDNSYNFPLNLVQKISNNEGKIDLKEIVFLHYHHSFYDMEWTKFFNFDEAEISWLTSKLPLFKDRHTAVYRHKAEYIRQYALYYYWKIKLFLSKFIKIVSSKNQSIDSTK